MRYWFDADVFIHSHSFPYPIGIANGFWLWMDKMVGGGTIVSTRRIFNEVIKSRKRDDPLLLWMKRHEKRGLCIQPTSDVNDVARQIGDYVFSAKRYPNYQRLDFSRGGDAWLIAAAKADTGTVVSRESDKKPGSTKVRIPDICDVIGVRCRTLDQVIREIPAKF